MSPRVARTALALYLLAIYATLGIVRTITNFLRDRGVLRISVVVAFVLAAAFVIWLIFRDRRHRTIRFASMLLGVACVYALVILPMKSPEEKIHFIEYGGVAALAYAVWPRRYVWCAIFVAAAGWIDEIIQGLLPSRYYDLRDVAFNAAAGLLALGVIAIFSREHERAVGTDRSGEVALDAAHRGTRSDG